MPEFNNCVWHLFDQVLWGGSLSGCSDPDAGGRPHRVPNNLGGHGGRATLIVRALRALRTVALVVARSIGGRQAGSSVGAQGSACMEKSTYLCINVGFPTTFRVQKEILFAKDSSVPQHQKIFYAIMLWESISFWSRKEILFATLMQRSGATGAAGGGGRHTHAVIESGRFAGATE